MVINIFLLYFSKIKLYKTSFVLVGFVFTLLEPIIRVLIRCKTVFILSGTKSECPYFDFEETYKLISVGE